MNISTHGLLELLAILIAFISVMLLLSLVVTALVQFVQSALRLRGRNLYRGLSVLFEEILPESKKNESKDLAQKVCQTRKLMSLEQRPFDPAKPLLGTVKLPFWVTGTARSFIDKEDLVEIVNEFKSEAHLGAKVDKMYSRLDKGLRQRFHFIIRVVSVLCALFVAFLFQVSTPQLLRDLSVNPEMREKLLHATDNIIQQTEASLNKLSSYEDISEEALMLLEKNNPDMHDKLEEMSGIGQTKDDLLEELSLVLEGEPNLQFLTKEYEGILTKLYQKQNQAALNEIQNATGQLATFDIVPWANGSSFYLAHDGVNWRNIVGVVMTAILLTLGAPFWFDRLKDVAKLRDTLQPENNASSNEQPADSVSKRKRKKPLKKKANTGSGKS